MSNSKHLARLRSLHGSGKHNVNINHVHEDTLSPNDRIARWVSQRVGTMWFCYGLAVVMFVWGVVMSLLGNAAPDRFPFPFLFFCLGGIMQSLLMPLIMVAQNLDARHSELRNEADYHVNEASFQKLDLHEHILEQHTAELLKQTALLTHLVEAQAAPRRRRTPTETKPAEPQA